MRNLHGVELGADVLQDAEEVQNDERPDRERDRPLGRLHPCARCRRSRAAHRRAGGSAPARSRAAARRRGRTPAGNARTPRSRATTSKSETSGNISRLTPPRPTRTTSGAFSRVRLNRRSTAQPTAKHASARPSSIQPAGDASAVSTRPKIDRRQHGRKVYRNRAPVRVGAGALVSRRARGSRRKIRRSRGDAGRARGSRPVSRATPARASSAAALPCVKSGMRGEKVGDDRLVLFRQHAARRVDEPSARLHQRGGRREDRVLLARKLRDGGFRLPPLEIGIAAQRAEARARRVDQHAVDLAARAA